MKLTTLERFLTKVVVQADGCWLWTGYKQKGYGRFSSEPNLLVLAHRWSYEHYIGSIPGGLQLDHLCRNPSCVNPHHLEPVTNRENEIRGKRSQLNPKKTSQYVGVMWNKKRRKWEAQIQIGGRDYHFGYFVSEEDAHHAYQNAYADYKECGSLPINVFTMRKTSQYTGVTWHKRRGKWMAQKIINGRHYYLGYFQSEEEAYQAYLSSVPAYVERRQS